MKISTKLSKIKYDFSKDHDTTLLVELEAPKVEWDKARAPICIIPVLDVSGSMMGEKLDYLKKACRKLFDHLSIGDFAGIVAYDTNVLEVAPIREITQFQKDDLKEKLSKLEANSCTNMSGGLLKALEWVNSIKLPDNVIKRVVLFTDGLANVGICGRGILDMAKECKGLASISAFGFGRDCDQALLTEMAEVGGGNYAFIDNPESALSAFARELGGLMSTYGQDIKVVIAPDKNNSIIEVLNDEDVNETEGVVSVSLRDVLSEEKKWIVANVKLNKVEKPLPRKVVAFKVAVSYKDKDGKEQVCDSSSIKISFCKPEEEPKEEDSLVVRQRDKLAIARAQIKAESYVRLGDYQGASACFGLISDSLGSADMRGLADNLSMNYSSAQHYCSTSDINNIVKSASSGRRVSLSTARAKKVYKSLDGTSNSAMDDMEKEFQDDEKQADNSIDWASTPSITTNVPIQNINYTSIINKKSSKKDW